MHHHVVPKCWSFDMATRPPLLLRTDATSTTCNLLFLPLTLPAMFGRVSNAESVLHRSAALAMPFVSSRTVLIRAIGRLPKRPLLATC